MMEAAHPANPYFDYTMVRDPAMFFGREEELTELYEAGHRLQSISLVGLRHIGKSSLLKYMCSAPVQKQFEERFGYALRNRIFVLIDLREFLHKNREDFFSAVSEQLFAHISGVTDLKLPPKSGADQLSELLEQVERARLHPVLLMDAFDKVTNNPQFNPDFFSFLRSQATQGKVSYVTASIRRLHEMAHKEVRTSPFFDIFTTCKLGPLTKEDAEQLVRSPAARAGRAFSAEEVAWILDQAGRHPFFLQVACRFLFDEKWRHEGAFVDRNHTQERIYNELLPHFEAAWNDLSEEQQEILKLEAEKHTSSKRRFPELSEAQLFRRFIYERFRIELLDITAKDVRDALDNMDNNEALDTCRLSAMHYISLRCQQDPTPSIHKRGRMVRELLKSAFERLRAGSIRSDGASEWRIYNILYYRYFRYHLQNEKTAARLGIGSKRQYYREQDKAIQALLKELIEMEVGSLREGIR